MKPSIYTIGMTCFATLGLCAANPARAGLAPFLQQTTIVGNQTICHFELYFGAGYERLKAGDSLTIYDTGPVSNLDFPIVFTPSQPLVGVTPADGKVNVIDSPSVENLTLTYTGVDLIYDTLWSFDYTIDGRYDKLNLFHTGEFASSDHTADGPVDTIGAVDLPNVPEPTGLAGLGAAGVGLLVRRRKAV